MDSQPLPGSLKDRLQEYKLQPIRFAVLKKLKSLPVNCLNYNSTLAELESIESQIKAAKIADELVWQDVKASYNKFLNKKSDEN